MSSHRDAQIAMAFYAIHMVSLPYWFLSAFDALWKQLKKKRNKPSQGVMLPSEGEFISTLMLAMYPVADAVRGLDACFEGTDGVCWSLWEVFPVWLRLASWWIRDVMLLLSIAVQIDCTISWTHAALGLNAPTNLRRVLRCIAVVCTTGIGLMFTGAAMTNRQSFGMCALCFVILLNGSWAIANSYLLYRTIPEFAKRGMPSSLLPWAAVAQARLTAQLILFCNVMILASFPCIVFQRLVQKHAHSRPTIPGHSLGSWVGNLASPSVTKMPVGVSLDFTLEIVEISIGWCVCVYLTSVGRRGEAIEESPEPMKSPIMGASNDPQYRLDVLHKSLEMMDAPNASQSESFPQLVRDDGVAAHRRQKEM